MARKKIFSMLVHNLESTVEGEDEEEVPMKMSVDYLTFSQELLSITEVTPMKCVQCIISNSGGSGKTSSFCIFFFQKSAPETKFHSSIRVLTETSEVDM